MTEKELKTCACGEDSCNCKEIAESELRRKLDLLLRTGSILMESAADTSRIMRTMKRAAAFLGLDERYMHLYINWNVLMVNYSDEEHSFSKFQRCEKHGINLTSISQVSKLNSYDEARQYANAVYQQPAIKRLLGNVRAYVISEPNLKLLGTSHTYEEYEKFYSKHFAPLPVSKLPLLLEPAETAPAAEEEPSTEEATSEESSKAEQPQEDNTLTVPITPQDEPLSSGELEVEGKKEEIPEKKDDGILVIPNQKEKKDDGTLVIPNQKKEKKEEDTGIYFDDSNSSESIELEDEYYELEGF